MKAVRKWHSGDRTVEDGGTSRGNKARASLSRRNTFQMDNVAEERLYRDTARVAYPS